MFSGQTQYHHHHHHPIKDKHSMYQLMLWLDGMTHSIMMMMMMMMTVCIIGEYHDMLSAEKVRL
jgi:hypothetical protein